MLLSGAMVPVNWEQGWKDVVAPPLLRHLHNPALPQLRHYLQGISPCAPFRIHSKCALFEPTQYLINQVKKSG